MRHSRDRETVFLWKSTYIDDGDAFRRRWVEVRETNGDCDGVHGNHPGLREEVEVRATLFVEAPCVECGCWDS